jgi:hypothetical protein
MKRRNRDSRFPRLSTKAMTGEATTPWNRRDEGGAFPVGVGKRVGSAGGKGVVRRWALRSRWGNQEMRTGRWGDSHQREEAVRVAACRWALNGAARGRLCQGGHYRVASEGIVPAKMEQHEL